MTLDEFTAAVEEEIELLPPYVFDGLNGGVLIDEGRCLHPGRISDDLLILGIYSADRILGKQIVLYYGSFTASFGQNEALMREKIRETVRHEFRHHLETKAGMFGKDSLVEEDRQAMYRYYGMHKKT